MKTRHRQNQGEQAGRMQCLQLQVCGGEGGIWCVLGRGIQVCGAGGVSESKPVVVQPFPKPSSPVFQAVDHYFPGSECGLLFSFWLWSNSLEQRLQVALGKSLIFTPIETVKRYPSRCRLYEVHVFRKWQQSKSSFFPLNNTFFFFEKEFRNSLWLKGNTPTNCALSVSSSYIYIFFQLWDIWWKTQGARFLSATIPGRNHLWQDSLETPMVATDFVPHKLGSEIWVGHSAQNAQPAPCIAGLSCSLSFTRAPLVRSFFFLKNHHQWSIAWHLEVGHVERNN